MWRGAGPRLDARPAGVSPGGGRTLHPGAVALGACIVSLALVSAFAQSGRAQPPAAGSEERTEGEGSHAQPGSGSGTGVDSGAGSESGPGSASDPVSDSGSESGSESGSVSDSVSGSESGSVTDSDSDSVSGTGSESGSDSDSDSDSVSGTGSESDSDSDSDSDSVSTEAGLAAPSPVAPRAEPWILDDGLGADVPWDDFDPAAHYGPPGQLHFGVQLRGGGLAGAQYPVPEGPWFEAGVFFDVRYAQRSPWHLRIVAAMSLQATGRGYGVDAEESNAFALNVRAFPLAIDLGDWVALRIGGGVDFFWAALRAGGGAFQAFPEAMGELVARAFDGRLELGVFGGMNFTAITNRSFITGSAQAVLGVSVGYLLQ